MDNTVRRYTVVLHSENQIGVLNQVANIFTRHSLNMSSMSANASPLEGIHTISIVTYTVEKKIIEVEKMLKIRLGEHKGDPKFKKFADKLDELRERMEQNLISSIDFLKQLLQMARELLEAEKEIEKPMDKRAQARAALTDLFQSIKTEDTPFIVEQVVNDIDNEVVNIIRQFNDAFKSVTARREIKKKLRSILWIKYQIKDNDVFERAYQYIEMYY